VWDTKYRPLTFADVLGQEGTVHLLKSRLENGTGLDSSYIFSGGSGQGKTTLARIYARALLCQQLDRSNPEPCNKCDNCLSVLNDSCPAFIEQDAASQGNVDQVRRIVDDLAFAVFGAPKKIYLFDECHRMSPGAQDVLLKPLEEKKLVGMFCTTEPTKVRGAIRSRCEGYTIHKVTREHVLARMKRILEAEKVEYEEEGVLTVIDAVGGQVREVITRLEMISQVGPVTLENARGYLNLSVVSSYYNILLKLPHETPEALALVDEVCEKVTAEEASSGIAEAAMSSFRLANGMMADFTYADRELGKRVYALYGPQLLKVVEYFHRSRYTTKTCLECDVAVLAQSLQGGTVFTAPQPARPTLQPLSTPASAYAADPAPAQELPTVSTSAPTLPTSAPTLPTPAPASSPPTESPRVRDPSLRFDGVGNKGSSDVGALGNKDTVAVPVENPSPNRPIVNLESRVDDERSPIPATTWRKSFENLWLGRGSESEH
jgi:DNA polymerase-3 subunit gamma/tau